MQAAAEEQPTAMAAVLKLSNEEVEQVCAQFAQVYPVNYNCPDRSPWPALRSSWPPSPPR